ncbi:MULTISPECIES: GntR family transcriptional regulator [unclassified Brenneria]|uniref:GntR family transcriptional regulator n=1 Tax=unclassified Brenneria TaxID=2634434 RepID=UPI0015538EEF|nr:MULTISPECIES: GntR family transcriptional regulator [unclassified Brenneria]MBJ7223951.1 GntR family transcriptional regulator [Brenneria sp. L3-3C-1]MEE3645195.1 GntR family transcriptional regulator [Brenneria sp. L3_3C_1]MEE3649922.1 GntR family transcriptional regulator [Brenneria sp. HEZEL_4_2_4]NPC99880.1 GntR family transcriptional regulator [Brenneria sp. hezel4-2-4]
MTGQSNNDRIRGKHPSEDLIYNHLINAIIDKKLRPGHHLNEVKLAESYNIPRSRVRRVLERLREEDIVEFKLHQGVFIARPTVADAKHVFEARRKLEYIMIQLVCERVQPADIVELRALLEREKTAFDARRNDVNRITAEFHFTLARIVGNPVIERMVYLIIQRCILVQSMYEPKTDILCMTDEHAGLVDSIANKDVTGAIRKMEHHIEHIISNLDLSETRHAEADIYDLFLP